MDDKSDYYFLIGIVVFIIAVAGMMLGVIINSHLGDIQNTKRTLARYELCKTIEDPASRTICANSNITIRR